MAQGNTEIEVIGSAAVKKHVGKVINKLVNEEVNHVFSGKGSGNRSSNMDFEDDSFVDDNNDAEEVLTDDEKELRETMSFSPESEEAKADAALEAIEAKESFDIFSDIGDMYMKKGQVVSYAINKSGQFLTKKEHPYSWETMQAEFGAGHYKVMARLPALNNKYLKGQSKTLLSAPVVAGQSSLDKLLLQQSEKNNNNGVNLEHILERITQTNAQALEHANQVRREGLEMVKQAKLEAREETKTLIEVLGARKEQPDLITQLTPLIVALAPLLKPTAPVKDDSMKMTIDFMKTMQEQNMKMIEKSNEATAKMISSLQESIKEVAKGSHAPKKDSDMSAFEMYQMMSEAEDRGAERQRLISEQAREIALEREDLRGTNDAAPEKESTVDTLLKSVIPMFASRMGGGSPAQRQAAPARVTPTVVSAQPRGSVSPQRQNHRANEVRTHGATVQTSQATAGNGSAFKGQEGIQSHARPVVAQPALSAPVKEDFSASDFLSSGDGPSFSDIPVHVENFAEEVHTASKNSMQRDEKNAENILTLIAPIVIDGYSDPDSTINNLANTSIAELTAHGIDLSTVERDFDDETLSGIIHVLPEDLQTQAKELRNVIVQKIKDGAK